MFRLNYKKRVFQIKGWSISNGLLETAGQVVFIRSMFTKSLRIKLLVRSVNHY